MSGSNYIQDYRSVEDKNNFSFKHELTTVGAAGVMM
jgi:hypothetical protein